MKTLACPGKVCLETLCSFWRHFPGKPNPLSLLLLQEAVVDEAVIGGALLISSS